jgi:hypothetical protein
VEVEIEMSRVTTFVSSVLVAGVAVLGLPPAASAASPPAAPSGLAASGSTINWVDNASDETGFSIERCLGAGCTAFGQVATVGAGSTTFADAFRASGVDRYRVRAFNAAGYSAYSNVAEVIVVTINEVFPSIAASPTSGSAPFTVQFDGSGSTSLNGVVNSYTWSFGDDQTGTGAVVSHTYNVPGVYAASLRVTAGTFNAADSTAVIVTVSAPPLAAPTDLGATSPARAVVQLTWSNPPTSTTSLAVERCTGSSCTSFARIATVATTATSYVDATVKKGTTYSYRLAASDATGTVYSNRAVVTARK